ncbi:MAG: crotonase/enoyl-CoA hydratase family protein [Myxococcota bacterium]|nr:crotonase/enoyl-CoA hydratase family protein [Myxococcales bacterium]
MDAPDASAPAPPEGRITTEVRGPLLLVGIDRVAKRNGFTPAMYDALADALTRLDEDDALRAGVVFAHGDHFTAGLDLPLWQERFARGDAGAPGAREPASRRVDPVALGRRCRKPIVTAVQGITYTLGIELMLAGDVAIAADDCRFSQLEPKRGIMASGGATMRFVERGGWGNAMYHLLLVDEFDAAEALRCGLVQEVVPAGAQRARAIELAERIAALAPLAVQATKASSLLYAKEGEDACASALAREQARLSRTDDAREGVASFVERREPVFRGR